MRNTIQLSNDIRLSSFYFIFDFLYYFGGHTSLTFVLINLSSYEGQMLGLVLYISARLKVYLAVCHSSTHFSVGEFLPKVVQSSLMSLLVILFIAVGVFLLVWKVRVVVCSAEPSASQPVRFQS